MLTVTTAPMAGIVLLPVGTIWVLVISVTRISTTTLGRSSRRICETAWAWDDITITTGPPCPAGEAELRRRIVAAGAGIHDDEWARFAERSLRGLRVNVDPRRDVDPDATETSGAPRVPSST